uniref:CKLF-like MARVEL transmembrane domain containing 7 n=1 Tax=Mus musculus TaxID=10090 RepID=A0A1L1SRR1_MOUSE
MSHGSGLVRTTCSSGGALGPGQPSEGLLDRVYPLTHGALFKVAQMGYRFLVAGFQNCKGIDIY